MHDLERNEDRPRGTYEFPFEFHHIDASHPRYVMSYHWHVEYEIIRILQGSLTVTLDEKSFTAAAGDVIFVHSGILHSGIPKDCLYQCIVFDMNVFLKFHSVCAEYIQKITHQEIMVYHHFTKKQQESLDSVNALFTSMWEKKDGYELSVFGQFYHFFGLVFSNHYYLESLQKTRRDYKRILQLKKVVEFIEKNYASPITLQELSASVGMSPKYFCRFFSEMTHQTPVDYLNRQRIEHACCQLAATDDSITEIAFQCGFNDLSYFIRTFRKYKGITPGKYKKH
ncbi:MAG: AraC family transcriptional regulator [Clostridiales bacterium]|nr:AraC family transcriptional regulator [Clostridiales bacterium]